MHKVQLKEVGSSHKDAPDALLPAGVLSDPTIQMSQVKECPDTMCGPLLYQLVTSPVVHVWLVMSLVTSLCCKMMLHRGF